MADDRPRRRTPLIRLGAPGPYVLAATFATALWFPARWYDDPDGPLPVALVRAGLWGVIWALFIFLVAVMPRGRRTRAEEERDEAWRTTRSALRRGAVSDDEAERAAVLDHLPVARRGALVGAVGGTLLFGALAWVALTVGRPASALLFGLVLGAVLAVAARTLFRVRRLTAALAGTTR
ncbi:hypothetical protein GA0074696_5086 [Micromonospora purpureochromogenes]|uniref:Transmembrane protein n=1 Tax=Micromonospora purpureochromogenes TaxID=47872 RepID=A0A1C4ZYT6_9ACTN|nr:hypothetical protein [Micromonospora purpureochromogenes]SCF38069.1 hypothetical protein GA0074696_5086 [Micromonospora purpureochromogenes]